MNTNNILKNSTNIGFWRQEKNSISNLPFPSENSSNYIGGFIEKLSLLNDEVTKNYKYYDYNMYTNCYTNDNCSNNIVVRLENLYLIKFKGFSRCRICNCPNGSYTLYLNGYAFPNGYFHYIIKHNIEVPLEFQQMICNLELQQYKNSLFKLINECSEIITSIGR